MATDRAIGTRIKKRRHVLDMTQQQLADAVGVSKSTVANWESGKHFPLRYLGKLESVLGVNLTEDAPPRQPVPAATRRDIARFLPAKEDQEYVIGLLEGTIPFPRDEPGADQAAG